MLISLEVKLVALTSLVYTIDLVDFYVVPSPYSMPASGYLSVVAFGGDPTGTNDSTIAFENVISAAEAKGQGTPINV